MIAHLLLLAALAADPAKDAAAPSPDRSRSADEDHGDPRERSRRLQEDGPTPNGDEEIVRHLELLERMDLLEHLELFDASGDAPRRSPSR